MGFCSSCGTPQPDGAFYCFKCGTSLVVGDTAASLVSSSPARGRQAEAHDEMMRRGASPPARSVSLSRRRAAPQQEQPPAVESKPSIRIVGNKFSVVPPFAIGGTLDMTDDSDSAPARSKRLATVNDRHGDGSAVSPRAGSAPRRKGRALVGTAPQDDRSRDYIFPDTIPEQSTPPRLKQLREDRTRIRKGLKTEADLLRETPGVARRLRVKKKHLASRNGLMLDEENFVADVTPNGPADIAGLKVGMRIIAIDGQVVTTSSEAMNLMRCKDFGVTVCEPQVEVYSSGSEGGESPRARAASGSPTPHQRKRSGSRTSTPRSGRRQDDVWREHAGYDGRDHPNSQSWELEAAMQDTPTAARQSGTARARQRRHNEKAKWLQEIHKEDDTGARRSRTPDRAGSVDSRQGYVGKTAAITISPPRVRGRDEDRDRSPGGRKRSGGARSLKPNHDFFNKERRNDTEANNDGRQRYGTGTGVEVYTSPRRLAYEEAPQFDATLPSVSDPVLAPVSNGQATPVNTTIASARSYPVSQPTPAAAPANYVSDTAKEEYRRRLDRYMSEGDRSHAQAQMQHLPVQVHTRRSSEPLTPFQHAVVTGYDRQLESYRPKGWYEADALEHSRSVSPPRGHLDTTESWLSDPAMRATTRREAARCLCSTSASSLGRSYNCTHCNNPCCMDCYWTGKCQQCKGAPTPPQSHFRATEPPHLDVSQHRSSRRGVCTAEQARTSTHNTPTQTRLRRHSDSDYADRLASRLSARSASSIR